MSELQIDIAIDSDLADELAERLRAATDRAQLQVTRAPALDRGELSVVQVLVTALVSQGVAVVFSVIKDYVTSRLKKPSPPPLVLQVRGEIIEINDASDLERLEDLLRTTTG